MKEVTSKANYESYETLADQLRIGRLDNLVCTDCGVLVVDRNAHNRLHSVMSSWAWGLAVLKTAHASAEIHDKYDVIPRIDSKTFVPAAHHDEDECEHEYESELIRVRQSDQDNYGHVKHRCVLRKSNRPWQESMHLCGCNFAWSVDENTGKTRRLTWDKEHQYYSPDPEPETSHPDRYEIARKLCSWSEENDTPIQRFSGNWLKIGDEGLTKRERTDRDLYLSRADQMIAMACKRDYARFLDNDTFRCLESECEREPEYENIDQVFIHARQKHEISDVLIESPKNEENKN